MKIIILAVGKTSTEYIRLASESYLNKISHYIPIELKIVADIKGVKNMSEGERKEREGDSIIEFLQPGDRVIILDEKGIEFTSRGFAEFLDKQMSGGFKRLIFIIGGPYGFSAHVKKLAYKELSLSKMTFSHEMVRLFFVEQIYRAMTILKGEPYHHD